MDPSVSLQNLLLGLNEYTIRADPELLDINRLPFSRVRIILDKFDESGRRYLFMSIAALFDPPHEVFNGAVRYQLMKWMKQSMDLIVDMICEFAVRLEAALKHNRKE